MLWHYTDGEGFYGIVSERSMRATSIRYLNDTSEYSYFADLVRSACDAVRNNKDELDIAAQLLLIGVEGHISQQAKSVSPAYIVSFSEVPDLLSQWRGYCADRDGYCIGFERDWIKDCARRSGGRLIRCRYNQANVRRIAQRMLRNVAAAFPFSTNGLDSDGKELLEYVHSLASGSRKSELERFQRRILMEFQHKAPSIKHPAFSEEKEWRIVVPSPRGNTSQPHFRSGRYSLLPYVNVELVDKDSPLPIKGLVLGPTKYPELKMAAAKQFLESSNVPDFQLLNSQIPFRA